MQQPMSHGPYSDIELFVVLHTEGEEFSYEWVAGLFGGGAGGLLGGGPGLGSHPRLSHGRRPAHPLLMQHSTWVPSKAIPIEKGR